jgi:hypothetical protein
MNKKKQITLVSIGAAVLLFLTPLTMVIGKQPTDETLVNSPLFALRVQNTIKREQNPITVHYLGKGKECPFSFPDRNNKVDILQKIIEKISAMTDAQLLKLAIFIETNKIAKENTRQILHILNQLKKNPIEIKKQLNLIIDDSSHITKGRPPTSMCMPTLDYWILGCILFWVWVILINLYYSIIDILEGG